MAAQSDIDRLIEMGLNLYGEGDLDGALLMWEQVLAAFPDNPQANSYVDYVRQNYDLLTSGEPELATDDSYGLDEDPEYLIEIQPGEVIEPGAPEYMDPLDEGWFMNEETRDEGRFGRPPTPLPLPPEEAFEDATREFYNSTKEPLASPSDFAAETATTEFRHEATGSFQPEGTPVGFASQETEIRKRDLGFVQPVQSAAPVEPMKDQPSSPLNIGTAPTRDLVSFEASNTNGDSNPFAEVTLDDSKTSPSINIRKPTTQEMPPPVRQPARRDSEALSQAEVMLPHAPTQDFQQERIDIGAPTRELGLRPVKPLQNPVDDDAPTGEADVRAIRAANARREGEAQATVGEGTRHDIVLPFDPIDARSALILREVDEEAPAFEPKEEQTRRRITMLLQRAIHYNSNQETDKAVTAVDLALSEDPNSALGQKLVTRNKDTIMQIFQSFIGDLDRQPHLAKPLHELANAPISPRAAFLLSRIDGSITIDELLDVSGMPRLEAYRHLCQLFLRGILR